MLFAAENLTVQSESGSSLLRNLDMQIPEGVITLLTGPNGSGKTILLRTLIGLQPFSGGNCSYRGRPIHLHMAVIRRKVGFLFQNPLYQLVERTVQDDIALAMRYRGATRLQIETKLTELAQALEIDHLLQRDPYTLSTGEQRRTVIAGMLAAGATTLLLDEPYTGLDYPGACELNHHLLRLREGGHSVVICTHDLNKIIHHAGHCLVLQNGRSIFSGTAESLRRLQRRSVDGLRLEPIAEPEHSSYP